jgi:hypothetical protein
MRTANLIVTPSGGFGHVQQAGTSFYGLLGIFFYLAGALLLTADTEMDVDQMFKQHQALTGVFAVSQVALFGSYALIHGNLAHAYWLPTLPFVYLMLRFKPVCERSQGFPLVSSLWALRLVLTCLVWGAIDIVRGIRFKHCAPFTMLGNYAFLGAAMVMMAYDNKRNFILSFAYRSNSPTAGLHMAIYTFFCLWGTQTFPLDRLWVS